MFTFLALVIAVIALVVAKRALDEARGLRKELLSRPLAAADDPSPRAAAPPVPAPPPAVEPQVTPRAPEPVIPIYQPPVVKPVAAYVVTPEAPGVTVA